MEEVVNMHLWLGSPRRLSEKLVRSVASDPRVARDGSAGGRVAAEPGAARIA